MFRKFLDSSASRDRAISVAFACVIGLAVAISSADAAGVTVVALGTSNTFGAGVARERAYPAQLQAALKARGVEARVVNAGRNGDTSAGMLARLSAAVPKGTRLVLLEIHANNELRGGTSAQTSANVAAIKARLDAARVPWLDISSTMAGYVMVGRSPYKAADGRHLNPDGYAQVVQSLVPQVLSALGR